jgi:NAD(P)-dependent dehydrogenase (short-subunit alcohol dehydrogenase family)
MGEEASQVGDLDGKVAIVTGAGRLRGIGRATAVALAAAGADVVVTGTGRDPATFPADEKAAGWRDVHSTVEQIQAQGRRGLALIGDISKAEDVARLVQQTRQTFGRIDMVVNNAAFARGADRVPVVELSEALFRRVLEIKLVGSFLLCQAVIPVLLEQNQGGRIINLSSGTGKRGLANTAAYCAANFGLQGFTQALAQELAPHRISVNAICPGIIDTARMDVLGRSEEWQRQVRGIPMQRAASDEEVAGLIAYLCSPIAEYITGQSINIDGGMVMW